MGKRLINRGLAKPYKAKKPTKGPKITINEPEVPEEILEPGFTMKDDEDCPDCPEKKGKK